MMINCPNCNLLQPEDQYCAGCGINMKTWKPPEKPTWKKIIGNWMFQLALLFIVVLLVVLKDSFNSKPKLADIKSEQPVSNSIPREEQMNFASSNNKETPTAQPMRAETPVQAKTKNLQKKETKKAEKSLPQALKRSATLKVLMLNRILIEKLVQKSIKNEDGIIILTREAYQEILRSSQRDFLTLGQRNSNFEFDKSQTLFIGEQDLETGSNLGFFMQINVQKVSLPESITCSLQISHQLQVGGEAIGQQPAQVSLNTNQIVVAIDPSAHDIELSPEDRALFESSPKLSKLNDEAFIEGLSDIALVLEIN